MILETDRLILKPYEVEVADAIFEVVKHREIADTMVMIPHPYPREVVDQWISYLQKSFEEGTAYEFAVFLRESGRYIGARYGFKKPPQCRSGLFYRCVGVGQWLCNRSLQKNN